MKHHEVPPYDDPAAAARKLVEIAAATPAVQDGRIYIERVNSAFVALLKGSKGHPEFGAGIAYAVDKGWLWRHESGTYLKLMPPGQDLLGQ
jgi:4-hydroxy-3-methylbut-2-enyl diphosphate reductase IspH